MEVRPAYDAVASVYADRFTDELDGKPFDRELLDGLAARLAGTGVVADVGCGPGQIGRYLADRGVEVVGVDFSEQMLAVGRERNPGMRFEQGDLRDLPFEDGAWAGAVAFYSLIHLEADELPVALAELHRVIAPGGVLCVAVHAGEGTVRVDDWFGQGVSAEARFWTRDEMVAAHVAAGFGVETATARVPYPEEKTPRLYVTSVRP